MTVNSPIFKKNQALVLFILLTIDSFCHALASFQSFEFAPNGVCIHPQRFVTIEDGTSFTMRNVPGEGDCMFLAVALATLTSMGLGANNTLLRAISRETRQIVATVLTQPGNLVIEGRRVVPARRLLQSASIGEGLSTVEYLELLRKEGVEGGLWGGGPELTVLSNILRRPISIYELADDPLSMERSHLTTQPIKCMGVFGDCFQDPLWRTVPDSAVLQTSKLLPGAYSWHLHILVVDVGHEKHATVLLPQILQ